MNTPFEWLRRCLSGLLCCAAFAVSAQERVRVAYFDNWPTPNLAAQADREFEAALGMPVTWQVFSNGAAMTQAMLDGKIDIAFSQGREAFVSAVNAGAPLTAVAVAAAYASAEDCIARTGPDVQSGVSDWLVGRSVALPLGTLAEFHFRQTLAVLGVELDSVTVVDLDSADAAAALVEGSVVMACGFGEDALAPMREVGASVLSAAQKRDAGLMQLDLVTVTDAFLRRMPGHVRAFLAVTEQANAAHQRGESDMALIAAQAHMAPDIAAEQLDSRVFPVAAQHVALMQTDGAVYDLLTFTGQLLATETHPALADYGAVMDSALLP